MVTKPSSTGRSIVLLLAFLTPLVFSSSSFLHNLSFYTNSSPTNINAANGSKIYLTSRDKVVQLSKITLTTQGKSITLDKLLANFDDHGFTNGWPVNSDLTISTTNSMDVTKNLTGDLFLATPTMSADPNFLVYVVRGAGKILDRGTSANTTIVFLPVYNSNLNNGMTNGFKHIRVESIIQPKDTSVHFYRYLPNDFYADVMNSNTLEKNIFSNPLRHTLADNPNMVFFDNIDPLQFSDTMWFRGVGGFQLNVSETYVDTTTIQTSAVTVTGMANSQLVTKNSQVNFLSAGTNRLGASGYVLSTDLFPQTNLTVQLNGQAPLTSSFQVFGGNDVYNDFHEQTWPAVNLQLNPGNNLAGSYFVQYFNIDNGPIPTQPPPSTPAPPATQPVVVTTAAPTNPPSVSSSSSSSSPTGAPPAPSTTVVTSTQYVETTTKSSATSLIIISVFGTLLNHVL